MLPQIMYNQSKNRQRFKLPAGDNYPLLRLIFVTVRTSTRSVTLVLLCFHVLLLYMIHICFHPKLFLHVLLVVLTLVLCLVLVTIFLCQWIFTSVTNMMCNGRFIILRNFFLFYLTACHILVTGTAFGSASTSSVVKNWKPSGATSSVTTR